MKRLIALITDFGYKDPYVGVMKAVIKSINPDVDIIDLTHGITRHDVLEAALTLAISAKYFQRGTIFVVVVDPGVGSTRRALLIETSNYILIGPDNGCLTLLAEADRVKRVFDISNTRYRLGEMSSTFHGRDLFAPVAAWVSKDVPLEEIGVEIDYAIVNKIKIEKPSVKDDELRGMVVLIDVYGNIMTNIDKQLLNELNIAYDTPLAIKTYRSEDICIFERSFSMVPKGALACYINSWGFLEIGENMGDAARRLMVEKGEEIVIRKQPLNKNARTNR
ncbi:MAG: S-adenosyl-l-methionine hydroxide adenosyltransferase family protein [Desulfurococcaceae archaeon]